MLAALPHAVRLSCFWSVNMNKGNLLGLRSILLAAGLVLGGTGTASAIALPPVSNCGYGGALSNLLCYEPSPGVKI